MDKSWVPDDVDVAQPSSARMYDYYLGGAHNFEVDRRAAQAALQAMPFTAQGAQANRYWLTRTVRFLVQAGVRQLLDLGSGVPTVGNVHEIAHDLDPRTRVVYIDIDPVATAHAQLLLADNDHAVAVQADMREVERVLDKATHHLDFTQPIGVLMSAVLHFVPDSDHPREIVARYREALTPGSYLAVSHMSTIDRPVDEIQRFTDVYASTPNPVTLREHDDILAMFDGLTLVEPGLVRVPLWRPESTPTPAQHQFPGYAAVGYLS
jgi:trans-aconitate methyltransferase